ncbi:MAG: serine hydrolase [Bacteroidetes bacterium]|nr:serine hydrolase [Bacteroidota bacterium]
MRTWPRPLLALLILSAIRCSSSTGPEPDMCLLERDSLEAALTTALDNWDRDTYFTLLLEEGFGRTFSHAVGQSGPDVRYRSASTSKWVTSTVILDLVQQGRLSLGDHPQQYIPWWPTSGNASLITLEQLLSFTSGLSGEPPCIHLPGADFTSCALSILDVNTPLATPGQSFHYGSSHMQLAGLMAIRASGASDWSEVFARFQERTGLFPTSTYDLPSTDNPRLAGGMHWTGAEYMAFLDALTDGTVLTEPLRVEMVVDRLFGIPIEYSPVTEGLGREWHYGLGLWLECDGVTTSCTRDPVLSSDGAYGAYPFIDREGGYFGIVAREGSLTSFDEGYRMVAALRPTIEAWAAADCN